MQGQVFTVAKLQYINGVVYYVANNENATLTEIAKQYHETTKSGSVKHPLARIRTLVRFAEGLGLLARNDDQNITITELGRLYFTAKDHDTWTISDAQKNILREHIMKNPAKTPTVYSITSLYSLVCEGHSGNRLSLKYAERINKQDHWKSDVTYEGFTNFGLSYLKELGLINNNCEAHPSLIKRVESKDIERPARTFLLTWNPKNWAWSDLPQAVYEANAEGQYLDIWSCGVTKNISPGDRIFLMRLGQDPKGIMGSGVVASEPFEQPHWDAERAARGETARRVKIVFDVLSDLPVLSEEVLSSGRLGTHNWHPQASGTRIPDDVATELENVWSTNTGVNFTPPASHEIPLLFKEGTQRSRLVTFYERNHAARTECLRLHGTACSACGMSFQEKYGPIGSGFIHVHHVVPVSVIQGEYELDPQNDLRPVCPNCHAMLHKRTPPYTIDELRGLLQVVT